MVDLAPTRTVAPLAQYDSGTEYRQELTGGSQRGRLVSTGYHFRRADDLCRCRFCAGADAAAATGLRFATRRHDLLCRARRGRRMRASCSEWIAAEGTVQWDTHKRLLAI